MAPIQAYAAHVPGGPLTPFPYEPGPLAPDEVEIQVESCGICHSDLSMLNPGSPLPTWERGWG